MAVMALPEPYRRRLKSTNIVERLNREIRRRERVICTFPNSDSADRLMGAVLMEQEEEWSTGWRYFQMDAYYEDKESLQTRKIGELGRNRELPVSHDGSQHPGDEFTRPLGLDRIQIPWALNELEGCLDRVLAPILPDHPLSIPLLINPVGYQQKAAGLFFGSGQTVIRQISCSHSLMYRVLYIKLDESMLPHVKR